MTDGSGMTSYAYVPVGSQGALQVQQATTPLTSGTIAYAYDAVGRVASRTVAGQGAESFGYDAIGRVNSDAGDLGAFTLAYLGQTAQIASRSLAHSNLATSWTYLPNSGDRRLASVGTNGTGFNQNSTFAYTTNAQNETTGQTQTSDAAIATPAVSSQGASYNNLNQLTNLTGQAFTFDADGNLTSDGQRTYTWDAENRLIAIAYPGQSGKATTFSYDGLGRRIQSASTPTGGHGTVTTSFLWCGQALCQARNASNQVTKGYYAEGEYAPGGLGQSNYYAPDQIGSVRRVFTTFNSPAFDYDAYGNALQATAPATDFGYAGMVTNTDSGLYLTTHRPYDPATGRFLTRDPIGEAGDPLGNLYAYVGGDPVDGRDPEGLAPGDPYPTAAAAGTAAVFDINPTSIDIDREYAGRLYYDPISGSYSYTAPTAGDSTSSTPGGIPFLTYDAGEYHTHGSDWAPNPYAIKLGEIFSRPDMRRADRFHHPSFIGTPRGYVKEYIPNCVPYGGTVIVLGRGAVPADQSTRRLPPPPQYIIH